MADGMVVPLLLCVPGIAGDGLRAVGEATAPAMLVEVDPQDAHEWGPRLAATLADDERRQTGAAVKEPDLLAVRLL